MSGRRNGRPRYEQQQMDAKLVELGGVKAVVTDLDKRGMPLARMVDWLEGQTGVRVHRDTLRNWLREWHTGGAA